MEGTIKILNTEFSRDGLKGITSQKAFAKAYPNVNAKYFWPIIKEELSGKPKVEEVAEEVDTSNDATGEEEE